MPVLIKNNATSSLAANIDNVVATITVAAGEGDKFPEASGSNVFYVSVVNISNTIEIMKVTARSSGSDSMTVVRGQDGTSTSGFTAGDVVELRPTAAAMNSKADLDGAAFTGDLSTTGNLDADGNLTVDGNTILGTDGADSITMNADSISSPNGVTVSGGVWEFGYTPTSGGDSLQTASDVSTTVDAAVGAASVVPTGAVFQWPVASIPAGYLECDGSQVSQATYANLHALLGTTYGPELSGNFTLPNFEGRVPLGESATYTLANTGGSTSEVISVPLKEHSHDTVVVSATETSTLLSASNPLLRSRADTNIPGDNYKYTLGGAPVGSGTQTAGTTDTVGDDASPTLTASHMQPYLVTKFIIKT